MTSRTDDLLRRPLYLYGLPTEVLSTLVPKDVTGADGADSDETQYEPEPSEAGETDASVSASDTASTTSLRGQACTLCGLSFTTVADQRGHLKSDLHNYNLKQKLRGQAPVTETEFERLVGNLDESLSGSDWSESESESEDNSNGSNADSGSTNVLATLLKKQAVLAEKRRTAPKGGNADGDNVGHSKQRHAAAAARASLHPFVWFSSPVLPKKSYFGVYRAMFTAEELGGADDDDDEAEAPRATDLMAAITSRQLPPISGAVGAAAASAYGGRHVFLCMIGGGHFAAMVVALAPRKAKAGAVPMNREATVLAHKTFHRYTTRRKQGGSQSANDAAKGAAHSAGSTLRRYNEQALVEDVRALLRDWKLMLDSADLLFVRASGTTNQRTLFGPYEDQVLQLRDPRLRSFPFNTRRPTQNEIMRAFIELTRLKVREIVPRAAAAVQTPVDATSTATQRQQQKTAVVKRSEEEETALLHTTQLQALARRSKVPALLSYLKSNDLSANDFHFVPADAPQNHHAPTLLHLAASQNAPALVSGLLLRAGADPAVQNGDGKTPFELAGDRPTRDAFRIAWSELSSSEAAIDWDAARVPAPITRAEAEKREAREKEASEREETERRRAEEARLKAEAAAAESATTASSTANRKRPLAGLLKSAQEIREEEARGLTPDQRQRLERERRARAAEARMRRAQEEA